MTNRGTLTPWLMRFREPEKPGARLVCLPHAGGAASFYHPMSAALAPDGAGRAAGSGSPDIDVLAVQYPGRQDRYREPCVTHLGALADGIAEALLPWRDLPLVLFGHSMGAVLAFEVTRRLERGLGPGPRRIIASGRRAPSVFREESVHELPDDELLAELRRLGGTDPRVLANEELLRLALPAIRGDYTAVETYRVEPGATVRAPLTVLTGDADPRTSAADAAAWREHTTGDFELHTFTGGHFFLADHQQRVAEIVAGHLV